MSTIVGQKARDFREIMRLDNPVKGNAFVSIEDRLWEDHKLIIKMQDMPITLADAAQGGGTLIATLPVGYIGIFGAVGRNIQITTTSVLASTLNASVVLGIGVGTVIQSTGTLATTQQDVWTVGAATSSAVINVAPTAVANRLSSGSIKFYDASVTPLPLFFNIGVPTATDIDADATVTVTGEIEITYKLLCALLRND